MDDRRQQPKLSGYVRDLWNEMETQLNFTWVVSSYEVLGSYKLVLSNISIFSWDWNIEQFMFCVTMSNILAQEVAILTFIRKVSCSNLGRDTNRPDEDSHFPKSLSSNAWTPSFHILSNTSSINRLINRSLTVCARDNVVK
jgi:hypothetical protein